MNTEQTGSGNNVYYEDEISLKELIMILLKNWKLIVIFTVVVVLAAGLYVFVIADEVYEASISGSIDVSSPLETSYGNYTLSSSKIEDYMKQISSSQVLTEALKELPGGVTESKLRNSIKTKTEKDSKYFEIKLTADSRDKAKEKLTVVAEKFEEALLNSEKERALSFFLHDAEEKIRSLTESLESKENEILALKAMAEEVPVSYPTGGGAGELNPAFAVLQTRIVEAEICLVNTKQQIGLTEARLEDLRAEEEAMSEYFASGDSSKLDDGMLNVMKSKVFLSDHVNASLSPIEPKKSLTMAIGLVLGLMLGVFVAFFKEYWQK